MGEGSEAEVGEPVTTPDSSRVPVNRPLNERIPVAVGTLVWALLFVIGLCLRSKLAAHGHEWWIWTAAVGVLLGLFGYFVVLRRRPDSRTPDRS